MNKTILLHNPRCRKSREAMDFLTLKKIDFEISLYIKTGLKKSFIKELLEKLSIKPIDLVRNQEKIWKENYKSKKLNNNEIISDDKFSLGGRWLRGFDSFGAGPRNSRSSYVGGNNIVALKLDFSKPISLNQQNPIYFHHQILFLRL